MTAGSSMETASAGTGRCRNNASFAARALLFILLIALPAGLFLLRPDLWDQPVQRFIFILVVGSLAGFVVPLGTGSLSGQFYLRFLFCTLAGGVLLWVVSYLQRIQPYPFSLTWSEGNHLWQASLFFRRSAGIPLGDVDFYNYVTPGLYGLRGLPFLFGARSMLPLRAWDALLWVVPPLLFAWALVSRWTHLGSLGAASFMLWGALFIAQGPVYAPLLIGGMVAIVAAAGPRPGRQRLGMLVGSLMAGLARWTWMVTPGLWALFLLRFRTGRNENRPQPAWPDLIRDVAAILLGAFASQALTILLTGHFPFTYLATLQHPLLWYRLFPNETFTPGILRSLALSAGPLTAALLFATWRSRKRIRGWNLFLTAIMMTVMLAAGLVISVKIGGGSNLHNLDMFLVSLVVVAAMLINTGKSRGEQSFHTLLRYSGLTALALLPVWQVVAGISPLSLPDDTSVATAFHTLTEVVSNTSAEDEVLFIDQRHLLALEDYASLRWEPAYEQVDMMDHALASDEQYFEAFRADVQSQRYRWIICDPQPIVFKGRQGPFGEENDAWVTYVSTPLMEAYDVAYAFDEVGLWILSPRLDDTHR